MKRIKKLITTLLLGALTLSVFAFTGCGKITEETSKTENVDIGLAVLASYTETTSDGQICLVKELTATVSGFSVNAPSIDLIWEASIPPIISATEENPIKGKNISDYLVLEPSAYDSTTKSSICKVKLIAPIEANGIIDIVVKCKNNNISARCHVKYNAIARSINVVCDDDLNIIEDENLPNKNICCLYAGETYTWNIKCFDAFNQSLEGVVDVVLSYEGAYGEFNLSNGKTYSLSDFINVSDSNYTEYFSYTFVPETGSLTIEAKNSLENLEFHDTSNGSAYYGFSEYIEYEPYFMFSIAYEDINGMDNYYDIFVRVVEPLSIQMNNNITFS